MKTKLALLIVVLLCSIQLTSQTRQEVIGSIQKLVSKTEGQKIKSNDVFSKKDDKLGKQVFSENVVSVNTIPEGKSSYEWVNRATEIPWNDFFDYLIYTEFNNSKLQVVRLNFKKSLKEEHFTNDKDGDSSPSTSDYFQFYVLTSDEDQLIQLLKRLESLKEKKAESEFNKEIAEFTQEQTITWLREKLKKNLAGDANTTSISIISMDACNLVFEYTNFVGRKYRETIPTNIAAMNKYNQFSYNKKICISKSYAFGMIQAEDETSYSDTSFLNIYTDDDDLVSNIGFAMKHLAAYCNNTNANKATEVVASTAGSGEIKSKQSKIYLDEFDSETRAALIELSNSKKSINLGGTTYIISNVNDFAEFLNANSYAALHWEGDDHYQFDVVGKTDFSKKSVEFTVKNDRLHLKANIPLNGNCDYGLKEFPVVDSNSSETRETADTKVYYFTLNFEYECNSVNYKYLSVFIEDKTLSSYNKVKEMFTRYGNK